MGAIYGSTSQFFLKPQPMLDDVKRSVLESIRYADSYAVNPPDSILIKTQQGLTLIVNIGESEDGVKQYRLEHAPNSGWELFEGEVDHEELKIHVEYLHNIRDYATTYANVVAPQSRG